MPKTDMILIVKRLQKSELGLFDAHRQTGVARSRQRGLNLDKTIIDLVLTPQQRAAGNAEVYATYRTPSGRVVCEAQARPIKHQAKNWRLTGNKLVESEFQLLTPGDFILMMFQLDSETLLYWEAIRLNESDPVREAMADYLSEVVGDKTTLLEGESREIILAQWKSVSPDLFVAAPHPVGVSSRYTQPRFL